MNPDGLVEALANGLTDVVQGILEAIEQALDSDDPPRRTWGLEALEAAAGELDAWPKHRPMAAPVLGARLFDAMGPTTRRAWASLYP